MVFRLKQQNCEGFSVLEVLSLLAEQSLSKESDVPYLSGSQNLWHPFKKLEIVKSHGAQTFHKIPEMFAILFLMSDPSLLQP